MCFQISNVPLSRPYNVACFYSCSCQSKLAFGQNLLQKFYIFYMQTWIEPVVVVCMWWGSGRGFIQALQYMLWATSEMYNSHNYSATNTISLLLRPRSFESMDKVISVWSNSNMNRTAISWQKIQPLSRPVYQLLPSLFGIRYELWTGKSNADKHSDSHKQLRVNIVCTMDTLTWNVSKSSKESN